jgi:hypothetical protein
MSIADWISLTEWIAGGMVAILGAICVYVWWVRHEAAGDRDEIRKETSSSRHDLADDIRDTATKFAVAQAKQDMDIVKLREDHDRAINAIRDEFNNFRIDISGKLFTRQDADVLRRDMTAMIEPVKLQVGLVQSSLDREMGSLKGKVDALCMGLLRDGQ